MKTEITITRKQVAGIVAYCNASYQMCADNYDRAEVAYNATNSDWNRAAFEHSMEKAAECKVGWAAALKIAWKLETFFEAETAAVSVNIDVEYINRVAPYFAIVAQKTA